MRACPSLACLILAACGSSGSSAPGAPTVDAPPPTVHSVTCPLSAVPTVMTTDDTFAYDPMTTAIGVGDIVKFVMSPAHNVIPLANPTSTMQTDPGLRVGFGQTACLKFDKAGTFSFQCMAHAFVGTIIVQ